MKKLEDIIIDIGLSQKVKIAQLYIPSAKCAEDPTIGIEIKNENAKYVIEDCAIMANKYLPIEVFLHLENPIKSLKGKIDSKALNVFAKDVSNNVIVSRLLYKCIYEFYVPTTPKSEIKKPTQLADIYGDYTEIENRENTQTNNSLSYEYSEVLKVLEKILK